jgi:hypothetical protein
MRGGGVEGPGEPLCGKEPLAVELQWTTKRRCKTKLGFSPIVQTIKMSCNLISFSQQAASSIQFW